MASNILHIFMGFMDCLPFDSRTAAASAVASPMDEVAHQRKDRHADRKRGPHRVNGRFATLAGHAWDGVVQREQPDHREEAVARADGCASSTRALQEASSEPWVGCFVPWHRIVGR
jgi:hypothetical protein